MVIMALNLEGRVCAAAVPRHALIAKGPACPFLQLFDELLTKAGVHRLCLPAAHETVLTWRQGFNFVDMPEDQVK